MSSPEPPFHDSEYCEYFQATVELIGRRWTASILRSMFAGASRFSEITAVVPNLSSRLLTERLGELIEAGLVSRRLAGGVTRYELTPRGRDLEGVFQALENWNYRWLAPEVPA